MYIKIYGGSLQMKLNGKENRIGKSESHRFEAEHERDMLDGNMNRMFVSDDLDEIIQMYLYAKFRLSLIYHYCIKMLEERRKNDAE